MFFICLLHSNSTPPVWGAVILSVIFDHKWWHHWHLFFSILIFGKLPAVTEDNCLPLLLVTSNKCIWKIGGVPQLNSDFFGLIANNWTDKNVNLFLTQLKSLPSPFSERILRVWHFNSCVFRPHFLVQFVQDKKKLTPYYNTTSQQTFWLVGGEAQV